jgi:hypothetical protein
MSHSEIIIEKQDVVGIEKVLLKPRQTLQSASGLFLADDSSDPTSSTLGAQADLADGDIETATSATLTGSYSVGLDLTTAKEVVRLTLYDIGTNTVTGISVSGANDSLAVYTSSDNSTWVLHETFKPLVRREFLSGDNYPSPVPSPLPSPLPYSDLTDPIYIIDLVFFDPPTTRYIKAYANRGALMDISGDEIEYTEVEAYIQPSILERTEKDKLKLKVSSIVTATPVAQTGDGGNTGEVNFTKPRGTTG